VVRRRALKVIATGVVSTMLAGFVAVAERVHQLDGNMKVLNIDNLIEADQRPAKRAPTADPAPLDPFGGQALNILITAIDSRQGENASVVQDYRYEDLLNDVNMVAHISADRSRVDIVSIPRDSLVPLPECKRPDGKISPAQREDMINAAFAKGAANDPEAKNEGMACVVKAIEQLTDISLDGFVLVEFASFAAVIDALGGVDICIPEGVVSYKTHIELEPGMHHLEGQTALQFARTRIGKTWDGKNLDGADTTRINRQQQLIATVINEVLAAGSLSSLPTLNRTATAITSSLHLSDKLASVSSLAGLAFALRHIKMENVSLFTPPFNFAGNRVRLSEWSSPDKYGGLGASALFELMALDQPIPGTAPYKAANPEPTGDDADPSTDPASPDPAPTAGADPSAGGTAPPTPDDEFVTPMTAPVTCEAAGQGG
jgi:LCP family protein required for cell wall assembly